MAPGDRPPRPADQLAEYGDRGDLVGQCLRDRPAGARVRRPGERVAVAEQPAAGYRVADVLRRVAVARGDVSVAVQEQDVPVVHWDLDEVRRAVRERAAEHLVASDDRSRTDRGPGRSSGGW